MFQTVRRFFSQESLLDSAALQLFGRTPTNTSLDGAPEVDDVPAHLPLRAGRVVAVRNNNVGAVRLEEVELDGRLYSVWRFPSHAVVRFAA